MFKNKMITLAFLKHRIKSLRLILPMVLLVSMLGVMTMPNLGQKTAKGEGSDLPRFNFLNGDYEMMQVAKTTDTTWTDPVYANIGDRVSFSVYYHNGIVGTTAHDTTIKVDLPINQGTEFTAKSYLWSRETAPITDTVVNGQIVGLSGGTIKTPTMARLEYVAGSTNWYPNGSQTPVHKADGIINGGINIGDIAGCWNYAGFLTFMVDIKAPASLVLDKTVGHPGTTGDWEKMIDANPGDNIAYHLGIRNDGGTTATEVTVKDILPTYMTYIPNTTYLYTKDHPEGIKLADTLFSTGVGIPDIAPGQDNVVYMTYKTKIDSNMPNGLFSLNNVAKVFMGGVEQCQNQARVFVTAERGLVLDKKVSNGVSWVEENSAKMGDTITYRILIRNTGNVPISNVFVRDALPYFTSYVAGSTKVDGVSVGDAIITANGLSLGVLNPGAEKTITLSGIINGCAPLGQSTLTNTAYGRGDSAAEKMATARTILTIVVPVRPN